MSFLFDLIQRIWNSFMNIDLLPGVNLGYLLLFALVLLLGGFLIRKFAL